MKKIIIVLLTVIMSCTMLLTVSADEALSPIVDNADMFTADEETAILSKINDICNTYSIDALVLTVTDNEGMTIADYLEKFYTDNGYSDDGIMVIISTETNTFYTNAVGRCARVMDEAAYTIVDDAFLAEDTYAAGIEALLDAFDTLLVDLEDVTGDLPYVIDNADLLTDTEETALADKLTEISTRLECDVIVLTEASIDTEAQAYADDYFDYNGYGQGGQRDGILMLVSMDPRKWHVSGSGICNSDLVSLDYICEEIVGYLQNESYATCFNSFADRCDNAVSAARNGEAYKEPFKPGMSLVISVVIGFIVAFIATGIMKGKLKTVRANNLAQNYADPGSLNVYNARDMFLYIQVTYTEKSNDSDSSNGSHTSSSGRSHSGKGGSF